MTVLITNDASSLLTAGINTTDLSISVTPGTGNLFPEVTGGNHCYVTLSNASGDVEIVRVSARAAGSDNLTLDLRGADNTTAQSWLVGDYVELCPVAAIFTDLRAEKVSKNTTDESNSFSGASLTYNYGGPTNIDEIHFDEATNTYHFTADTTRAANGNARLQFSTLNLNGVDVTATSAQLDYTVATPGTAAANKALVVNGSRDIANINSITAVTFNGALNGNAATATNAGYATNSGTSAACSGNSATASAFNTSRTAQVSGVVTGSVAHSNGTFNIPTSLSANAVQRSHVQTATVSLANTLASGGAAVINMEAYAFFPMIHLSRTPYDCKLTPNPTDRGSPDLPCVALYWSHIHGGTADYDFDYRYINL